MASTARAYTDYVPIPQALDIVEELTPNLGRRSENFIRLAIKDGRVRAVRVGGRHLLVNVDDIHAMIAPVTPGGAA